MKLKMNVKTILLFTALFILGTMILGFYSCSGGSTTPVSPQLTDDPIVDSPLPGDITAIITEDGDITTVTTEDGTTIVIYIVTIDEDGSMIITTRESASIHYGPDDFMSTNRVELEFTDFVPDGPVWTGTATITNNSLRIIGYPRVVIGQIPMGEGYDVDFATVHFIGAVQDPDIYCGLYQGSSTPLPGYPTVFIADEDENYQLEVGGVASHDISIRYEGIPQDTFRVYLMYELQPLAEDITGSNWTDDIAGSSLVEDNASMPWEPQTKVPKSIDIEFVECVAGISTINVTLGIDPENWAHRTCIVEDTLATIPAITFFVFLEFNLDMEPVYSGTIEWDPAVDGPIDIMAYFTGEFLYRQDSDAYMDFTTLT